MSHLLILVKYEKCECSYKKVGKTIHRQYYIKLPQNGMKIVSGSCEQLVGFPLYEECRFKHESITAELAPFLLRNLRLQPLFFSFLFMWPCVVTNFLMIKPTACKNFSNYFCKWNSTYFGQFLCPLSGVSLYTQKWYIRRQFLSVQ
jgi:hypothetical protein